VDTYIHPLLTSALDGSELSALGTGRFNLRAKNSWYPFDYIVPYGQKFNSSGSF